MIEKIEILAQNSWLSDLSYVENSASTQLDAKNDLQDKKLFIADTQTAARGRFGRDYFAVKGAGIYMSLALKAREIPENYTILTAAAIVTAIENLTTKKPLIKWVNDIYLDDKKICGILVEHHLASHFNIIGVGLNFSISNFPIDLRDKAGSLFDDTPTITRSQLIAEIWREFVNLQQNQNFLPIYKSHSLVLGKTVEFEENGRTIIGTATDLTENGELIVNSDGLVKVLSSGEISLKKWC
ncbi:biotin--[acetyl-CoA-carboxylase] ligase [Lactococcus hodotermopsidis]|uniref:biotin--[biotin carboxyl-carrier protein] ligase n=1 Tax=Pseudolactococcus hodotermopsidis TaxID=2709157 RepID=A0A6A0BC21_9LACT|nr:biotin--[acetyl-CoA-carboxylase] ligase [Lactococcus hodotermopsidis]GFH42882.1 biotin--[acetyl-CoA-carboxylase] ligase [Lactococcus hodotermopsidis]